jgi:starch-binding outer membrane protein, SusD/RagB family
MKKIIKFLIVVFPVILFYSCEDYLEKTPLADVTDEDIFSTYENFQGFIDPMYSDVLSYTHIAIGNGLMYGGDVIGHMRAGKWGNDGDYWGIIKLDGNGVFVKNRGKWGYGPDEASNDNPKGMWSGSWSGIRKANIALEYFDMLSGTEEENDLIKGQAHFFRAFFHWEIIRCFGGMPYIDKVLLPDDDMELARLSYQESTDRIVEDLDMAASLLPEDWDLTVVGGARPGANAGKVTKGAALAFKAKALLYAGSPLMNGFSGNDFTYNKEYMEEAAAAAWEVIKMANEGLYALIPFENYRDMFARNDQTWPWTTETIFQHVNTNVMGRNQIGKTTLGISHGRVFSPGRFQGNAINHTPNQLYIDRFEMADGTRYKEEYDNDDTRRWEFRDPRFRQNVLVDRDQWGFHEKTVLEFYEGGQDNGAGTNIFTPYIIKKYWPKGVNKYDNEGRDDFKWVQPQMRLADVYLIYAEAVNEAYGANGSVPGASFTAVDAVNIVRNRAGMPDVNSTAAGYDSFRELVWNERCVELCFEASYWMDIRRWYVGHLPEYKPIVDLVFDKDWTSFNRVVLQQRVFDNPKHYWLPIPRDQTLLYPEFSQNPGW